MSFFSGLITFIIAFLIHLLIWRGVKVPKKQTNALLIIFFSTFVVITVLLIYTGINKNYFEVLRSSILFTSLTVAYVFTYTALEVDSPTLVFIKSIADTGKNGLPKDDFDKLMNDELLIKPRVKDLVRDNFIVENDNKYELSAGGRMFVNIFIFYRKLLNAPRGG